MSGSFATRPTIYRQENLILKYAKIGLGIVLAVVILGYLRNSVLHFNDFKVTYRAGERALKQENLYNKADGHYIFKYSPIFAVAVSPLGKIPYSFASIIWLFSMCLCLYYIVRMGKFMVMGDKSPPEYFYFLTIVLTSKFLAREFWLGQTDFLQLLLLFLFINFYYRKKEIWGGLFLALSAMIKLTPLIFLPYFLYSKCRDRPLGLSRTGLKTCPYIVFYTLAFVILFLSLPALIYGWQRNISLLKDWYSFMSYSSPPLLAVDLNQSIFGLFLRLFTPSIYQVNILTLNSNLVMTIIYVVIIISYLFLLFLSRYGKNIQKQLMHHRETFEFSLLLIFMNLFSPLGWVQNFSSSLLAYMVLVYYSFTIEFKDKTTNILLLLSFILTTFINFETVGRRINDLSLYYSFITWGIIIVTFSLFQLRLRKIA
jgi:hypothetical protein